MPWLSAAIETKLANFGRKAYLLGVLFAGGCFFNADYGGGHYTCSDGICPAGLVCDQGECVTERKDAAIDTAIDAHTHALTCADPGDQLGSITGTTVDRSNTVSAMCGGSVHNGPNAVYRVVLGATQRLRVTIDASYAATAYVLASGCTVAPATPACTLDMYASPGNPIVIGPYTAGSVQYVVVDSVNPALSGPYSLTLDVF